MKNADVNVALGHINNRASLGRRAGSLPVVTRQRIEDLRVSVLKMKATMNRISRNDPPRGILPETLTARPKSRGTISYYSLLAEG